VVVGFPVLAGQTLTLLTALDSRTEAFTVILATGRFLAGTLSFGDESWHSLESTRVAVVGHLLRLVDVQLVVWCIAATRALTPLITHPPLGETLAVHLQTVDLRTLASRSLLLAGR
jgi:hypothetical protein